jgi:rare lipoprotein A (peptidoglycan hydrolase)
VRRPTRVVATVALTAAFAMVAVPGSAGSRVPSDPPVVSPDLFEQVEVLAAVRGPAATIMPLDPGARSAGRLDRDSTMVEPTQRQEPPQARPDAAQPQPDVESVSRNVWRTDGNVSWYGPGFYGNRTACGQAMTSNLVGVAHRTLPCGTRISFRNPDNGRVVTVLVVDRGPYVAGRRWDLTAGACRALGHCYTGPLQWRYARAG